MSMYVVIFLAIVAAASVFFAIKARIELGNTLMMWEARGRDKEDALEKIKDLEEKIGYWKDLAERYEKDIESYKAQIKNQTVVHEIKQVPMSCNSYEGEIGCDEDFDNIEYVKKVVAEDVGKKAVEKGFVEIREQTDAFMCKKVYHYKVYFWK